jgi:TolA-binding protein
MIVGINNPTEKITLMNNLARKFPGSTLVADANMEIASAYLAEERFREAIPFLLNVVKAPGNSSLKPRALLRLGLAYYNLNNNNEALNQYKLLVSQYPNSEEAQDALENVRSIYIDTNRPDDYAEFMRNAGKPLSVDAADSLSWTAAQTQYENGNTAAALTGFNSYLQRFPQGTYALDANFFSGEIYYARKDWNNALKHYERVASLAPNKYAETAVLLSARMYFFEIKDYTKAENYYQKLKNITDNQANRLEAMRGLLRSQYQLQKWSQALENAKDLAEASGSSTDDKALANMAIAKSHQVNNQYDLAINHYKTVVSLNKAALAAEARYEIANSWLQVDKLAEAEKAAFETINKSGSYDFWVTKAYILLGDVFMKQKDYFNAKATYQSVVDNTINTELKTEAQTKLKSATEAENKNSKVGG